MPVYTGRVYMSLNGGAARDQFSNTFHFSGEDGLASAGMAAAATAMATVIASVLLNTVTINRIVCSTFAAETLENNYNNFRSFAVNVVGGNAVADAATTMYDINHALVIARNVELGRAGALLIRGCLTEADVQVGTSGDAMLSQAGRDRFNHVPASFGNGLAGTGFAWGMARRLSSVPIGGGEAETTVLFSPTISYAAQGVRLNKRNHKYFDRAPSA